MGFGDGVGEGVVSGGVGVGVGNDGRVGVGLNGRVEGHRSTLSGSLITYGLSHIPLPSPSAQ